MKRIRIAVLFLLLAAVVCITEQICLHGFYRDMSAKISAAQQINAEDKERLQQAIKDIRSYWNRKNDVIFMMTKHSVLDEFSAVIRRLDAESAAHTLDEAKAWLEAFYENQRITPANIF